MWTCVHALVTSQSLELLSAFSSCSSLFPPTWKSPSFPVLVPDIRFPVPGSCVCLLTARSDSCLLCTKVMFSWSVLLGCCGGRAESAGGRVAWSWREPRKSCSSAKAVGCSSLACSDGITVAWLMGAVRRSNVLCAEERVFRGCSWQTLKSLVSFLKFFFNLTKSRQFLWEESRVHSQKQWKPCSQILSTNHTEVRSPQWDGREIPFNVGKIKYFALSLF